MQFGSLGRHLAEARSFSEVGAVVCEHLRTDLDGYQSLSALFTETRRLAMMVDDLPLSAMSLPRRVQWLEDSIIDPQLAEVFATEAASGDDSTAARMYELALGYGYTGARLAMRTVPMIGPNGVFAVIRFGTSGSLTPALHRDLGVVAAYTAARCVQLGIANLEELPAALSPRQREVMELASRGLTNTEIGNELGTSFNTVKKQLKEVFDRCGVSNRTELASLRARYALRDPMPRGANPFGAVIVTR